MYYIIWSHFDTVTVSCCEKYFNEKIHLILWFANKIFTWNLKSKQHFGSIKKIWFIFFFYLNVFLMWIILNIILLKFHRIWDWIFSHAQEPNLCVCLISSWHDWRSGMTVSLRKRARESLQFPCNTIRTSEVVLLASLSHMWYLSALVPLHLRFLMRFTYDQACEELASPRLRSTRARQCSLIN